MNEKDNLHLKVLLKESKILLILKNLLVVLQKNQTIILQMILIIVRSNKIIKLLLQKHEVRQSLSRLMVFQKLNDLL
jgi:hypothetical protein